MRQHYATFANFICRFGLEKVLLDYANDIVLPALSDESLKRQSGPQTTYFIKDFGIVNFGEPDAPVLVASGRFIKNTVLRRTQVYDPERGLVPDLQTLASAPSAYFVLILNNHRIIYFPETPFAPDLPAFEATVKKFIGIKYRTFIDQLHATSLADGKRITKVDLRKVHQPPTVNIVPLSNEASVEVFLKQFSTLKSIEFELIKPNQEIDGHELWQQLRSYNERLEPDKTIIRTERGEGFDIEEAKAQITDAAGSGNQRVHLSGLDRNGNKISGDNEKFSVTTRINDAPIDKLGLVKRLYDAFANLLTAGTIRVDQPADDVTSKLTGIRSYL